MQSSKKRVYRNLNSQCWSIQHYIPNRGWRVEKHTEEVCLTNVDFKVYESGNRRAQLERRRNVHAFAVGTEEVDSSGNSGLTRVSYNYKVGAYFYTEDGEPVHSALMLYGDKDGKLWMK